MKVKLSLENETKNLPSKKLLTILAKEVLKIFGQKKAKISLGVFYVDNEKIKEINSEYRQKDKETDVISFRLVENPNNLSLEKKNFPLEFDLATNTIYLGEIFICESVASLQAPEFGNSTFREVAELFIHGLLHLLGCDHHKKEEAKVMKNYEEKMIEFLNKKKIY